MSWSHAWPATLAAFLASLVEFVEAMTVVLAVGAVRGWGSALRGSLAALGVLALLVAALGPLLTRIPLAVVQVTVGGLLLLFGLRWLRKAILRSAGVLALRDEAALYTAQTAALRSAPLPAGGWDRLGVATAFQITLLEGTEVVFIVIAVGAGGGGLLRAASAGAAAALLVVVAAGLALHRPIASLPENLVKLGVGILLSAFGTFWAGEGAGLAWPGADWSLLGLVAFFAVLAWLLAGSARRRAPA